MVLAAWRHLRRQRHDNLKSQELQGAQLCALLANINRDPKKGKPYSLRDFMLWGDREERSEGQISPTVAAIAMQLQHEGQCPPLLITVWDQVLKSVKEDTKIPTPRVFRSDDEAVWILAPKWEGANIRGELVVVRGRIEGAVVVRDLDKPLITHTVFIPRRQGFGWLEAGCLLLTAEH